MSGCHSSLCSIPANNSCAWLFRGWVTAVPYCISSLLMMHVLWISREWVVAMSHSILSLLTKLVLGSPEGWWLLWPVVLQACWHWPSLATQKVTGCLALLCFEPANDSCFLFSSLWVAAILCCIPNLLTTLVLGFPVCESHPCLTVYQTF